MHRPGAVEEGQILASEREPHCVSIGLPPGGATRQSGGQRAHRNPIALLRSEGNPPASTANTPAAVPSSQLPPRFSAPGRLRVPAVSSAMPVVPGPPKQLKSPPKSDGQLVQETARSAQSATHSFTFPTMSNTPQADVQLVREPVSAGPTSVTQVLEPSSAPRS